MKNPSQDLFKGGDKPNYDRSEAGRVQITNIVEDPNRPDRNTFETLINQELLELNGPKLVLDEVYKKVVFGYQIKNYWEI